MGKWPKQTFSQTRHTDGQFQVHEKFWSTEKYKSKPLQGNLLTVVKGLYQRDKR